MVYNLEKHLILYNLSISEDNRTLCNRGRIQWLIKECQRRKRLSGIVTDIKERKLREQRGLDTPVV